MGKWLYGGTDGPVYVLDPEDGRGSVVVTHTNKLVTDGGLEQTKIDAHAQMLAARVEGLEKDINGLQHLWPTTKGLNQRITEIERIIGLLRPATQHATVDPLDAALALLHQCLSHLPMSSELTGKVYEFLRNR